MSAETKALRAAVTQIRSEWDNATDLRMYPRPATAWLAVADWLESPCPHDETHALAVARAYLGESA